MTPYSIISDSEVVGFVGQANIAYGQQQVNNAAPEPEGSHAARMIRLPRGDFLGDFWRPSNLSPSCTSPQRTGERTYFQQSQRLWGFDFALGRTPAAVRAMIIGDVGSRLSVARHPARCGPIFASRLRAILRARSLGCVFSRPSRNCKARSQQVQCTRTVVTGGGGCP